MSDAQAATQSALASSSQWSNMMGQSSGIMGGSSEPYPLDLSQGSAPFDLSNGSAEFVIAMNVFKDSLQY